MGQAAPRHRGRPGRSHRPGERNLFAAEQSLAQTRSAVYQVASTLYKAMGGGWVDLAAARAPQSLAKTG
ncbi:MAG TPA: hypothetical protein VNN09_14580 [Candidatus Competibacteraceae bacterium]|nr:hypothetical protein [Candidatus Competibacteraceae bacterium]